MSRSKFLLFVLIIFVALFSDNPYNSFGQKNKYKDDIEALRLFETVYKQIKFRYYRDIDPYHVIYTAINAIIKNELDPHSYFYKDKKAFSNLKIQTEGEYGGLGMRVSMQDGWLTVVSPMFKSPALKAGIMSGDKIIKINGKSTKGYSLEELVEKLRGKVGTKVTITINRDGEIFDITLVRDKIIVPSIPYYGVYKGVGYIHLVDFSKKTEGDLIKAINDLKKKNIKGIVLDLRNNPGGLLDQAIKVVAAFIGPDKLVVTTKSRYEQRYNEWKTNSEKIYDGKLVVLVNRGSASASEIVSGTIQDYDRGVIIGTNTFGKGSVQNIFPLDMEQNRILKLTTSHYYIPSGRCIHKITSYKKYYYDDDKKLDKDSLKALINTENERVSFINFEDSNFIEILKNKKYYTNHGREVHAGNGIEPDIIVKDALLSNFSAYFRRYNAYFKFAVEYRKKHPNGKIDDEHKVVEEFKKFCNKHDYKYKSQSSKLITQLEKSLKDEKYSSDMFEMVKNLETKLQNENDKLFYTYKDEIIFLIKQQLLIQIKGEDAVYPLQFSEDPVLQKAVEIIKNDKEYNKILSAN